MVKKEREMAIDAEERSRTINENGKRPAGDANRDGKKRQKTKNLFRQPTVNELNRLQETETLFNSNLFRLQVEEILQEVKLKEKTEKKFQQWFANFKSHLGGIPEDEREYDLSEPNLAKKLKVKLPIPDKLRKTKCMFKFLKFNEVEVVGSYSLSCAINSKLCIDLQVTVPSETYTKNDSLNYRYHKKRAAYLACLASHLTKLDTIEELKYTWPNGCQTQAVLDITPVGKLASYFTVRLSLACESEAYKLHRFSPSRNNLRETWLLGGDSTDSTEVGPPTPFYNSTVLSDLTTSSNHNLLKETLSNAENLRQAIVLLKIWLCQRKLQLSGHVISLLVAYLVQMKRINNIMSSYQIVRNVWIALKTSEWDTKGISLHKGDATPSLTEFTEAFPVVFLDVTGFYNLCWNVTTGTYEALKRESALAIEMLDNTNINSFLPLFMVPFNPLTQFDHIVRFKNLPKLISSIISRSPKETKLNYGVDQLALVTNTLHSLLAKGLGDRVELILQLVESEFSWEVKKTPEKAREIAGFEEKLSFGLILHPENALNVVMKGPHANLPEAEEFRAFWGEKSELRRFQDGAITETCVWEGDSMSERGTVCKQIVDYLLQLKYDIPGTSIFHVCGQLSPVWVDRVWGADCAEGSLRVVRAFDQLRLALRALTGMPLEVSAVYGVSPVLSYMDPVPPAPRPPRRAPPRRRARAELIKRAAAGGGGGLPEYMPAVRAVVELGHSGKWPGSLEAFRCVKAAMHQQLAARLTAHLHAPAHAHVTHVHVYTDGIVFRLEIAHPKEITLLRRSVSGGVASHRDTDESVALTRDTALLPRLRGALHGLQAAHPALGPTVCLLRRWLSAHLLGASLVPPAVCELLGASVFLSPAPLAPPAAPLPAFVRALTKLYTTDWSTEMIVLDFNGDMKREETAELEAKFASDRSSFPPMCIVTSCDGDLPSVWTREAPAAPALARMGALARAAVRYLEDALCTRMEENVLPMFVPSLSGYDVLIHLHPRVIPHYAQRLDSPPAPRLHLPSEGTSGGDGEAEGDIVPVVEFNPVRKYLDELTSAYGAWACFFYDEYGGDVIAVLWRPGHHAPADLQLSNAHAMTPIQDGSGKYKLNLDAIIADFKIIGQGIVKDVTVCS